MLLLRPSSNAISSTFTDSFSTESLSSRLTDNREAESPVHTAHHSNTLFTTKGRVLKMTKEEMTHI